MSASPDALWPLFEKARNDLGKLVEILDTMDDEQLRSIIHAYGEALDLLDIEDCRVDLDLSDDSMDDLGDWVIAMGPETWKEACKGGESSLRVGKKFLDYEDGTLPPPWRVPDGFEVNGTAITHPDAFPAIVLFEMCQARFGESFHEVKWETIAD